MVCSDCFVVDNVVYMGTVNNSKTHIACIDMCVVDSNNKQGLKVRETLHRSAHTWCGPPMLDYTEAKEHLNQRKNVFKNKQLYWINLLRTGWKQDCTHVYHRHLNDPLPLI